MRVWGLGILGLAGTVIAVSGWRHLWPLFHHAGGLALFGWSMGMVGIGLLVGRRKTGGHWRFSLGLVLSALGLALLAIPRDGQGLMTGLNVGYVGALLAVLPHSYRLHRTARAARERQSLSGGMRKEVL